MCNSAVLILYHQSDQRITPFKVDILPHIQSDIYANEQSRNNMYVRNDEWISKSYLYVQILQSDFH